MVATKNTAAIFEYSHGSPERAMREQHNDALSGNPAAAAVAAMLIHLYPEAAQAMGLAAQYGWLLSQALRSTNGDLLTGVGEELVYGKRLASDEPLALRFFTRADDLSAFMGSYAQGRVYAQLARPQAITYLRKARIAGHIPSAILEHQLIARSVPLLGYALSCWYAVVDFNAAWKALRSEQVKLRFWRYRDVFPDTDGILAERLGKDRLYPFALVDTLAAGTIAHGTSTAAIGSGISIR